MIWNLVIYILRKAYQVIRFVLLLLFESYIAIRPSVFDKMENSWHSRILLVMIVFILVWNHMILLWAIYYKDSSLIYKLANTCHQILLIIYWTAFARISARWLM